MQWSTHSLNYNQLLFSNGGCLEW